MVMKGTNLGRIPLGLNTAEWKSMSGLIKDPRLTMEQSQMAIYNRNTQIILVNTQPGELDKGTLRLVYPEKGAK